MSFTLVSSQACQVMEVTVRADRSAEQMDVTEFTITVTGATVSHPQNRANFQVPEASGAFCDRGGRLGPHSTEEEFGPPFCQKMVFVAYFNAGVRS